MSTLIEQAQAWLAQDPDSETRAELQAFIDANDEAELKRRFEGRLQFGTAGLRGRLQAGPNGMNRVLVAQAAAGLARYLGAGKKVVIGYDGRKHSRRFAKDTAEILQASGIEAYLMPDLRPTPVLAFALRVYQADAGVMVTASHNPAEDNGYKVYLGGEHRGAQIVPPADADIAAEIDYVAQHLRVNELPRDIHYHLIPMSVIDQYIERTAAVFQSKPVLMNYVYTAMHGVGTETLLDTLHAVGLTQPQLVETQAQPDANFPTVAFPNPEEKGALDLAIELAKKVNAEFIIANDPDADRLAVALPSSEGVWERLHGNMVGLYLAWHLAQRAQAQGKKGVFACSLVSSPLLKKIAAAYDMTYQETPTGFKWIGRIEGLIFGFEEALGYLVDADKVADKDGISAAIAFLDLMATLKAQGRTFLDYMQAFQAQFGAFHSQQISIRIEDNEKINRIINALREKPFEKVGDYRAMHYCDHLKTAMASNMLVFELVDGHRVIVRPSGTEPKLKIYLDTFADNQKTAAEIAAQLAMNIEQFLKTMN